MNSNWATSMKEQAEKQLSEHPEVGHPIPLQDSGQRDVYGTGAQRDNGANKGRFDLIAPQALLRLARHYEYGSKKYAERNWEHGMPIGRMVDAAMRHLVKYLAGANDEDHLAAVLWNVAAIMHYEAYNPNMQDLPTRRHITPQNNKFIYPVEIDMGDEK